MEAIEKRINKPKEEFPKAMVKLDEIGHEVPAFGHVCIETADLPAHSCAIPNCCPEKRILLKKQVN